MSADLIQALRRARSDLDAELADAESKLTVAQQTVATVRSRWEAFRGQLNGVCSAAGISISAVLDTGHPQQEGDRPVANMSAGEAIQVKNPLALPSKSGSQRWYAGQALHQLGGQGSIAAIAAEMRRLGYEHSREPLSSNQLEASLAALPSQVRWIVAGDRPGHLRLHLGQ